MSAYSSLILSEPGLLNYWRLDDRTTSLVDIKGGNTGTIVPSDYVLNRPGLVSDATGAIKFGGVSAYATIAPLSNTITTALTMEAWFQTTYTAQCSIIDCRTDGNHAANIFLANTHKLQFWVGVSTSNTNSTTGQVINDGLPHHFVGTFDGSFIRVFIDGAATGTPTALAGAVSFGATPTAKIASDASNRRWVGLIDELAVYNRVLSPASILQHYKEGAGQALRPTVDLSVPGWTPSAGASVATVLSDRSDATFATATLV